MFCICFFTECAFAANPVKHTSLSIYDTNSVQWDDPSKYDELVATGYFKSEVQQFESTIAKKYKHYQCKNITSEKQVKKSIKKAFKNTDSNDVNIIFIACHGGEDGSFLVGCKEKKNEFELISVCADDLRKWCDKYINGKTVIITSQCYGGIFAKEFYYDPHGYLNGGKKKNVAYAKKHYAIMTATNKTSNYAYSNDSWYTIRDWYIWKYVRNARIADIDNNGKLTLKEWYNYTATKVYESNIISSRWDDNEPVDRGVLYGGAVKNIVLYKYK